MSTSSSQFEPTVPTFFDELGLTEASAELQEAVALQLLEEVQAELIQRLAQVLPQPTSDRLLERVAQAQENPERAQAIVEEAISQYRGNFEQLLEELVATVRSRYVVA